MSNLVPQIPPTSTFNSKEELMNDIHHFLNVWPGWSVIQKNPPTQYPARARNKYSFYKGCVLELTFEK